MDECIRVSDQKAFDAVEDARDHNLLVGPSSGAVYTAAKMVAKRVTRGRLVLVLGDDERKFTSPYSQFKAFEVRELRRLVAEAAPGIAYSSALIGARSRARITGIRACTASSCFGVFLTRYARTASSV